MGGQAAELKVLGHFSLTDPFGRHCPVSTKKNRALLAILALSQTGFTTRERLCGLLWGDRGEEQARSSLRQTLAVLRKELGALSGFLKTEDDRVGLDQQNLNIDVSEFFSCARSDDLSILARAADLHRGELLADLSLKEDAFENWLSAERRRVFDTATLVYERLSSNGNPATCVAYAKKLVGLDPLREASQRALIGAYNAAGERGLALQQYEECKKLLATEFNVTPAAETLELRSLILGSQSVLTESAQVDEISTSRATADRPSIAVLPFTNLSADPEQQYFADGVSEDVITALTRFKSLAVVARNTSFRYRGDVDVSNAGQKLGAHFVVAGSIRRIGVNLRISAQLIEAKTAKQIWAEIFNAPEADLFKIQDDLVQTIAGTLVGRIADASVYHTRLKPPGSLAAYELLLRANSLNWESLDAKIEAQKLLESAIRLDPEYATAYALLAAVELRKAAYHSRLTADVLDTVVLHARKAVEIDPNDSACHSILGWVLIARRESELAAEHLSRALQLNPNNPFSMVNRGSLLVQTGRPDEALQWFSQANRTDPYFNPSWVQEKLALAHFTSRRYDLAASHLSRASGLRFYMRALLAASLHKLDKLEGAKLALKLAFQVRPDLSIEIMHELIPFSNREDELHLREALRAVGIPE